MVWSDKQSFLPLSRLLTTTRRHVATCQVPSTASSPEAEGAGLFWKTSWRKGAARAAAPCQALSPLSSSRAGSMEKQTGE